MDALSEISGIDVGFDPKFEDTWWAVAQAAWLILTLRMIAGIAGAFGRGPLAKAEARSGAITVRYERLLRFRTPSQVLIEMTGPTSGPLQVEISGNCFRAAQVTRATPQPVAAEPLNPGAIYSFPSGGAGNPTDIAVTLEPGGLGAASCRIASADAAVNIQQFIFP